MSDIVTRLKAARQKKYPSATAFAQSIGYPAAAYRHKESGRRELGTGDIKLFADALGVTTDYLLSGEKALDQEQLGVVPHTIPLLTWGEAEVIFSMGGIDVDRLAKSRLHIGLRGKNIVALRAPSDMSREVLAGSAVCVDVNDKALVDGRLYLLQVETAMQVRRYVDDPIGARFEAEPLGDRVAAIIPGRGEEVVGRIVQIIRDT